MVAQSKLIISGGAPLQGHVSISGAKNEALKAFAATLLTTEPLTLSNIPYLRDITLMLELLADLGATLTLHEQGRITIHCHQLKSTTVPYKLVNAMRASIVVLGPLLAAHGEAEVALPGGCAIGLRPIDMHLDGLRAMGASIEIEKGFIKARTKGKLQGAEIHMHTPTVTGTENLMMAATLADGVTTLHNAAREPEVVDLAHMLNAMGAKIKNIGRSKLKIEGVPSLHGTEHNILPDRIEAGTYLTAAAMTGGEITVEKINIESMKNIVRVLTQAGANVTTQDDKMTLSMQPGALRAINITTAPYPGIATDMQAQFMAMNCIGSGVSTIHESIFENRFMHVPELNRLGANIRCKGNVANIIGDKKLTGTSVMAHDLRAAASLVLAGLAAEGTTEISGIYHLDRGYEFIEEKFSQLGADIHRTVSTT